MGEGPGKFGGSRQTVRKRAQRKRKAAKESNNSVVRNQAVKATNHSRPVLNPNEGNIDGRMESLAYEAVTIAMQLKKSFNNSGKSLEPTDPIIQDASRAAKILNGLIKDNNARRKYDRS